MINWQEVVEFPPIFFVSIKSDSPCVGFALNAYCHPELICIGTLVLYIDKVPELTSIPFTFNGTELFPCTILYDPICEENYNYVLKILQSKDPHQITQLFKEMKFVLLPAVEWEQIELTEKELAKLDMKGIIEFLCVLKNSADAYLKGGDEK